MVFSIEREVFLFFEDFGRPFELGWAKWENFFFFSSPVCLLVRASRLVFVLVDFFFFCHFCHYCKGVWMSVFGQWVCLPSQQALCSHCSPPGRVRFWHNGLYCSDCTCRERLFFLFLLKEFFFSFEGCILQCLLQHRRLLSWCISCCRLSSLFFCFPYPCVPLFSPNEDVLLAWQGV